MARRGRSSPPIGPDREVFTTGEAAKLCNVTIRTVIRWIDTGALSGYKVPGGRDRRVPRDRLIAFMRAHGLPLGPLESAARGAGRRRLLIVDDEAAIVALLVEYFRSLDLFDIETATNGYEAGTKTMAFRPDLLLIDYNLGDVTGLDVARTVRARPELVGTRIVCMSGFLTDEQARPLLGQGIDDFVTKPLDLERLRARVYRLVGLT